MDADAYQELLDRLERAEAIVGVREGLASMERGEGRPLEEVVEAIRARGRLGSHSVHRVPRDQVRACPSHSAPGPADRAQNLV